MPNSNENPRETEPQARQDKIQILKNENADLKVTEIELAKQLSDVQETTNFLRAILAARQEEAQNQQN